MQILPLKFVHEDDKKIVGLNLYNLAKLKRLGIPVIDSLVAIAPAQSIDKIIRKYLSHSANLPDQLNNLKKDLLSLKAPESLTTINFENSSGKKMALNLENLWKNLLEKWSYELISKIERGEKNLSNFTPQQIVLSSNFLKLGSAYFDEAKKHVVVKVESGKINFEQSEEIEKIVLEGNKKLVLPQIFYWTLDADRIKIVKLAPFTQNLKEEGEKITPLSQIPRAKTVPKTATKIILDLSDENLITLDTEAVFLRVEKTDEESLGVKIEKILNLKANAKIIFYPEFEDLPEKTLDFAKTFLFFKHKKQLDCQIVMPETNSLEDFLSLKRQFASLGIYSKGSVKIWKEFKAIGDFLSLEQYLEAGFDGAVIDLDKLVKVICGVDADLFLSEPRVDWIYSVEKFFKEFGLTKLIKNKKQVLVTGKSVKCEELLNYFIKSGVWGIGFSQNDLDSFRAHISFLERSALKTKPQD